MHVCTAEIHVQLCANHNFVYTLYIVHVELSQLCCNYRGQATLLYMHMYNIVVLIGVHELHGQMHTNQGHVTNLFAVDPLTILLPHS